MVGVFNVQGSCWSRTKRAFHTHDPSPPVLETLVRPTDVHSFAQTGSSPQHFAMYSDQTRKLTLSAPQEDGVTIRLAAGKSDVVTVGPLLNLGSAFLLVRSNMHCYIHTCFSCRFVQTQHALLHTHATLVGLQPLQHNRSRSV